MSSSVIPCIRYRDAPRMITWLSEAFGFKSHYVVPNDDGSIAHAQLTFGTGMIMVSSVIKAENTEAQWAGLIRQPEDNDGLETQSPYLVVANVDEIHARAKAAGAEIVIEIGDQDYGSREFSCRDPEGHLWSFGTYDPWTAKHS